MKDCIYSVSIVMSGDYCSVENMIDEIVSAVSPLDLDAVSIIIKNLSEAFDE